MLKPLLFFICFICSVGAYAKKTKISVGINEFSYTDNVYKKPASQLQDIVLSSFMRNNDFEILDRSKVELIQKELGLQKGKEYIKGKTVKQNEAYGAQIMVFGKLNSIDTQKMETNQILGSNSSSSSTTVHFSLQAVDVRTGLIKGQQSFSVKSGHGNISIAGTGVSGGSAVSNAQNEIMNSVADWINEIFPPKLIVDTIDNADKKGFPDVITILSTHKLYVEKNSIIEINEVSTRMIDEEVKTKIVKIAELQVLEPQGDFIKCKVMGNNDILDDKLKTNPDNLYINLTDKKAPRISNPFKKK
jgi:curli biogenesis system outer membrane secretion channel CsgG